MEQKKNISSPKIGMQRDTHQSLLKGNEYSFAMNANTENETGEKLNIMNEPSNYFSVAFPEGYKVIHTKKDLLNNRTYYFLTNPTTQKSSIGYVEDNEVNPLNQDNSTACDECVNLSEPLESQTQTPSNQYIEILNDECHNVGEGLNFHIDFPIKFSELKQEKLGTYIYWNDYRNRPRWMNLTDTSYLFEQEIACEDPTPLECFNPNVLLQFPKHSNLHIEAEQLQTGGQLKLGAYEFYVAYCDQKGNEFTGYSTPTNPINIFDENNQILLQTQLDDVTNFAIKLKVSGLDLQFKYYKVVVAQRTNVNNIQAYFVEGVHPTTDDTIIYSSEANKERIASEKLYTIKPVYTRAKGIMSSNNIAFQWGLETRRELNLQPIANLLGGFVKWQTSVAKEDLFKSAIATSKYKGYMRNEVQPFGIRFSLRDGGTTPVFPLVARPATSDELELVEETDKNYLSIIENVPNCAVNTRDKIWQIYNTASVENVCNDFSESSLVITEEISRTCVIEEVATVPGDTIVLELDETYTNLQDYIEDNYDEVIDPLSEKYIPEIAPYLVDTYPSEHCMPNFEGDCDTPELDSFEIFIDSVIGETNTLIEKTASEYTKNVPPKFCQLYKIDTSTGNPIRDDSSYTNFEELFMPCNSTVYLREGDFLGEGCGYAYITPNNNNPTNAGQGYSHNYYGDVLIANLQLTQGVDPTTVTSEFTNKLHKGALWFKIDRNNRDKIVFEITKKSACEKDDSVSTINKLRYNFYSTCSSPTSLGGAIVDADTGILTLLDLTSFPNNEFYVAIDVAIEDETIPNVPSECPTPTSGTTTKYRTSPLCGCFSVFTRDLEYTGAEVTFESIIINKKEVYKATCDFNLPEVDSCDPVPYAQGKFAYYESTEEYPNNAELYNSKTLNISEDDFNELSEEQKSLFEDYYVQTTEEGEYILKEDTDLRCKPIRHFKFPNNKVAPFMVDVNLPKFAETLIFPLGISLDNKVVETFLKIARNNGLISQEEFENIEGYEILKADNTAQKSVIANGLAYDMYKYTEKGKEVHYANFPHNDLGEDLLHIEGGNYVQHPFDGEGNNKFSFLSPDLLLNKLPIPTEVSLEGFQMGNSRGFFNNVEEHSKWVILGDKAKSTALRLALLEVELERIMKESEYITTGGAGHFWILAGFAGGTNAGGAAISTIATIVAMIAHTISAFVKVGQLRYQWLNIFRDLGTPQNFSSYYVSEGYHNRLLKNEEGQEYLRGISVGKHLKDYRRYEFLDEKSLERIKVNSYLREYSTFLSLGNHSFNYPIDYYSYDNNKFDVNIGSKTIASQNACNSEEIERNVGSPYFSLKNWIQDQFGAIDSIKWLTTNYKNNFEGDTSCETIFGGNVSISRFTWKRKVPMFTQTAFRLADRLPFNYSDYPNIASPKYYCDYETGGDTSILGALFPDINTEDVFDCKTANNRMYIRKPSKFYLWYYGIANFLVESEINCNFRYGGREPKDQFYPLYGDIVDWTQEKNVSIGEPNKLFYNNVYSIPVSNTPYNFLDKTYNRDIWEKRRIQDNAVIYSEQDNSENDLVDPWLIYKPLNWHEFPSKYGKLIQLKDLESTQVLGRFENQPVLFNAIDNLADRITPINKELGTAGIFATRPLEFKATDLGYAGTQHSEMVSTPYGHFMVDAKRGKVFMLDQKGTGLTPISETNGQADSGMKNWFKEQLPFKILKYFPELDIDNKYKGIGMNIWWDSRFDRVFFTKRDYLPKKECIELINNDFYYSCAEQTDCENNNLVINGDFNTNLTGWYSEYENIEDTYYWNDGKAWFRDGSDQAPRIMQDILTVGTSYIVKFDFYIKEGCSQAYVRVFTGSNYSDYYVSSGTHSIEILMTCEGNTTFGLQAYYPCQDDVEVYDFVSFDNVCVTEQNTKELIQLDNEEYFEDVSWTVSYKVTEGAWNSYFSFYPDYSVSHQDYFQTGYNWGVDKETMWTHPLNNTSFQVFQGRLEPFIVELPIVNQNVNKLLNSVSLNIEAKRYQNEWDFTEHKGIGFNKAIIYNNTNNSNLLELVQQKTVSDTNKYPKTKTQSQEILYTAEEGKHTFNYFFNRVKNQDNNVPIWVNDKNRINKELNQNALSFTSKRLLERLKGETMTMRLINDKESRFNIILKDARTTETFYE